MRSAADFHRPVIGLRSRLARRGVAVPAGLIAAGASTQAQACVPEALVRSTIQIAHGLTSGNGVALLAKGVLNSMWVSQLKIAAGVLLDHRGNVSHGWNRLGLGSAPGVKDAAAVNSTETVVGPDKPGEEHIRVRGIVVDETGRPVAGINVQVGAYTNHSDG